MPFIDSNFFKEELGVEGKTVLLTFGLLSPNKGIKHAILERHPNVVYIVLGAETARRSAGREVPPYREKLERLVIERGVEKQVTSQSLCLARGAQGVHRRGRYLHHPLPQ